MKIKLIGGPANGKIHDHNLELHGKLPKAIVVPCAIKGMPCELHYKPNGKCDENGALIYIYGGT